MQFEQLGPYRLGKLLGKGGMGMVYEGLDVESGQPAAVKVLSPSLAAEEGFRVRFEAEIESLKKLRHPNIVRLYGYGEQAGTLFYAMELVHGTSLEDEVRAGRRFDWREVTQIAVKLCRALKHAHDHGVIHRDLKPANVLLTPEGDVKLSDFGIARLFGNTRLTADGGVLGTAEYMAPEQAAGQVVTDRCDQYSLGGMMYALLAGRAPFRAKTLVEMLQLQRYADPDPVTRYAPQTPAELARIIHQLLEKSPHRRFSNTLILSRSLEAMERGLSISASRSDDCVLASPDVPAPAVPHVSSQTPTLSPAELAAQGEPDASRAGDFDETAATMAYGQAARPSAPGPAPDTGPESVPLSDTGSGRFTKVDERREPLAAGDDEQHARFFSPQTVLLAVSLALLILAGWYLMQPPSADRLYTEIESATSDGDLERLKAALPKIEQFLAYYPDDPRAESVRALEEEAKQAHPIERAYTEAKRLAVLNPDLATARFQALIDVYDDGKAGSDVARHYVKLARIRLKDLNRQLAQRVSDDRQALEARLERADELAESNPPGARKIFAGIVALYDDKPWARELVARARAGLVQLDSARAAVEN